MSRSRFLLGALACAGALAVPAAAAAQTEMTIETVDRPAVRILQDYTLRAGDTARQIVVIGGDARIAGHVTEDVVVVLGHVELANTAVVDGSFVVVAGGADIADGAKVQRDFFTLGGVHAGASFSPGGQEVVIGTAGLADGLRALVPWLTHGLVLGRLIVPSLGWIWMVAAAFFLFNLCVSVLFDAPVGACAATLRTTPFSACMAGLLVMLLAGPVCVLLAVSVVGIVVIPFLLCALLAATVLGRVGFARWIGMSLVHQDDPLDRAQSTRSFVIGSALMGAAYMVPFVGIVVWFMAGVFGLGAATLSLYASYRRENPKPPRKTLVPPPTAPPPPLPVEADGALAPEEPAPAQPAAASLESAWTKGTFTERLAALALDAIAITIIVQLLDFDRHPGARLTLFLALVYHVGFWTWRGTTPGGMICQLRVVHADGRKPEFAEALVRGLAGIFSLAVAGLGFLWMLRDPERQTWHDRLAGTYVVKVPRAYPV